MTIAALLHVTLAVSLFIIGRAQLAPTLVDRDGIVSSFAFDSNLYRRSAFELAQRLRTGDLNGFATTAEPAHVKVIAIPFALFGSFFGYSVLSAEPYNLICYIVVIGLVFALGREVGCRRTGILAATAVGVWPTFLLHTMQLLKEPLFVAASLAFLLCVITWITRTYKPMATLAITAVTVLMVLLVSVIRLKFLFVVIVVALLGLVLLAIRQILQRRLLLGNMVLPIAVLLAAMLLMPSGSYTSQTLKKYPSDQSGPSKTAVSEGTEVLTDVQWVVRPHTSDTVMGRLKAGADRSARRISSMRTRFAAGYPDAGSLIDGSVEFSGVTDLLAYLPRAVEIGLWAPFPNTWFRSGRFVGYLGKILTGFETFLIYCFSFLAVAALVREPRRLGLWFVLATAVLGATALALVVPNFGALYRFRYGFWVMIIIAAMTGLDGLIRSRSSCRPLVDP